MGNNLALMRYLKPKRFNRRYAQTQLYTLSYVLFSIVSHSYNRRVIWNWMITLY